MIPSLSTNYEETDSTLYHMVSCFNPFPNKPWLLHVCCSSLLKRLGKGEIACFLISQIIFHLFKKQMLIFVTCLTLFQTSPGFYLSALHIFRKHRGKMRYCVLLAISPFSKVFSIHLETFLTFPSNLKLSSANPVRFEESKIFLLEKG